ncbi:MAG: hypothetical protein WKF56_01395, partial [Candidatus Limnocylindrales bacterium]
MAADPGLSPKSVANWVTGEYLRLRNATDGPTRVDPVEIAAIVRAVEDGSISRTNGKAVLAAHLATAAPAASIIAQRGYRQIRDREGVAGAVEAALAANPAAVADLRAGKMQAIGFLVGQVMKATGGQADPALVQAEVRRRLEVAD